jgi:hypothetical protein
MTGQAPKQATSAGQEWWALPTRCIYLPASLSVSASDRTLS